MKILGGVDFWGQELRESRFALAFHAISAPEIYIAYISFGGWGRNNFKQNSSSVMWYSLTYIHAINVTPRMLFLLSVCIAFVIVIQLLLECSYSLPISPCHLQANQFTSFLINFRYVAGLVLRLRCPQSGTKHDLRGEEHANDQSILRVSVRGGLESVNTTLLKHTALAALHAPFDLLCAHLPPTQKLFGQGIARFLSALSSTSLFLVLATLYPLCRWARPCALCLSNAEEGLREPARVATQPLQTLSET